MSQSPSDEELVGQLLERWRSTRLWAERLLESEFGLPGDDLYGWIAKLDSRAGSFPGTKWLYRIHGAGIEITTADRKGGIDFDFDQSSPDPFRLREFLILQLNDGALPRRHYRQLLENAARWKAATAAVLGGEGSL